MSVVQTGIPGVEADAQGNIKVTEQFTPLTALAPASSSVGTTSVLVLAANASRRGLVLMNISKKKISFGLDGATAVLDSGITLLGGGAWTMDRGSFTVGAIEAVGENSGLDLAIQEFE